MTHLVVLKDWTIEIKLSEDGESVTVIASENHGSQYKKTFKKHKKRSSLKLNRILSKESFTPRVERKNQERSKEKEEEYHTPKGREEKEKEKEKEQEKKEVGGGGGGGWVELQKEKPSVREAKGKEKVSLTHSQELASIMVKNPIRELEKPRRKTLGVPPLPLQRVVTTVNSNHRKPIATANRSREENELYQFTHFNESSSAFFLLPQEVQIHIFSFLTPSQLSVAQKVCTYFRLLARDDIIWKGIFLSYFGGPKKRGRTWRQESMSVLERVGRHTRKHHAELLLWGARHGHTRFVENILERGQVDINSVKRGNSSASPLHLASHEGHLKTVKLLLSWNADVNARTTYGRTPLERAAKSGHKRIVELLLDNDADVNAATCGGETPLLVAASGNHKEVVKTLLAHGADVNATSQLGFTALRIATLQGFSEIVRLLSAHATNNTNTNNNNTTSAALPLPPPPPPHHSRSPSSSSSGGGTQNDIK